MIYVMAFHKPEQVRADPPGYPRDVQYRREVGQAAQYSSLAFIIAELPDNPDDAKEFLYDDLILQAWDDGYVLDYDYAHDLPDYEHYVIDAIEHWQAYKEAVNKF